MSLHALIYIVPYCQQKSFTVLFSFCRYGSRDCGFAVEERELDVFPEEGLPVGLCGDPNIEEYLQQAVQQNTLQQPQDWESATELYLALKDIAGF